MADQDFILAPTSIITEFVVEPVTIILHSMQLMNIVDMFSGFDHWVTDTLHELSPEQVETHKLVLNAFFDSLQPERIWSGFPEYLDDLKRRDPVLMRDRSIEWLKKKDGFPGTEVLLNDGDAYVQIMAKIYEDKGEKAHIFDGDFWRKAHATLQDPERLKKTIITHLTMMWETYMKDEWKRIEPRLHQAAEAHRQMDYSGMGYFEIMEAVTGRDLRDTHKGDEHEKITHLIFVPSAHIGPYVGWFPSTREGETRTVFSARLLRGMNITAPDLSRSELLIRLSALADDTRLQIMELLTQNEEMCAQDFINLLDLSQSSASRHLRQLTASGYLRERRKEVAKCYSLNRDRIDDTVRALKYFLDQKSS